MAGSRRSWPSALGLVALASVLVASQSTRDVDRELKDGREELSRLEAGIQNAEARIKSLSTRETDARTQLAAIEEALAASRRLRDAHIVQLDLLQSEMALRLGETLSAEAGLDTIRTRLAAHVRLVHRRGKPAFLEILFEAGDFGSALRRARYVAAVLSAERTLMRRHEEEKERLRQAVAVLEDREREYEALFAAEEREARRLDRLENERAAALDRLRSERTGEEAELRRMQERAKALDALIASLEAKRNAAGAPRQSFEASAPIAARRGQLPWPVQGTVMTPFGTTRHPRYGTATFSPGIDIKAPAGTPVAAVAAGQVEFVDWVEGYGKTVILSHGGGYYSLYAHASDVLVTVGSRVETGATIARVGSTDSLIGDCLHFELRHGGEAVDPQSWLRRTGR